MKILIGAAALLLVLTGCAAQEATPEPVSLQTQDSGTAEPNSGEPGEMEEPEELEVTEPASEQPQEPTAEPTAETTTQAEQTAEASPSPTATAHISLLPPV